MTELKDIFLDKDLRCGGFYELSIQVCPSIDNEPIKRYTDFIWSLEHVYGPYDNDYNPTEIDIEGFQHRGVIKLGQHYIPFMTYNIRETEPVETGFNWFDICFYTAAIESVFGAEYKTWMENPKVPNELSAFFLEMMKRLYDIYPFKLAMADFEISGQYYLDGLKTPLANNWGNTVFYVGEDNYEQIAVENRRLITKMEDL